jgi:hypothetical protein
MCNKDLVSLVKPSLFMKFISRLAKSEHEIQLLNGYRFYYLKTTVLKVVL